MQRLVLSFEVGDEGERAKFSMKRRQVKSFRSVRFDREVLTDIQAIINQMRRSLRGKE